jgi:type IV pilus assembly protein PilV
MTEKPSRPFKVAERRDQGVDALDQGQVQLMEKCRVIMDDTGFTLLEVMFAVVILALGLLGMMAMQLSAIQGNGYGMKLTEAAERIESRMEAIRSMPYEGIVDEAEGEDAGGFTRTTTVQEHWPQTGVKTVEVSVSWRDGQEAEIHTIAFHTIIME